MALDMFMRIEGVNGESKDANHKDWTDIKSFTWGAEQPGSMNTGGGGGAGKRQRLAAGKPARDPY